MRDESLVRVAGAVGRRARGGGHHGLALLPLTAGGPIDWNIPEIWADERTLEEIRAAATPPGLLDELEREATGGLTGENFGNRLLAHDPRVVAMAAYLLDRYRPTLLLAHTQATVQVRRSRTGATRGARAVAASDLVVSLVLEVIERTKA